MYGTWIMFRPAASLRLCMYRWCDEPGPMEP